MIGCKWFWFDWVKYFFKCWSVFLKSCCFLLQNITIAGDTKCSPKSNNIYLLYETADVCFKVYPASLCVCVCVMGSGAAVPLPPRPCHWSNRLGFQDWTESIVSSQTDQDSAAAAAVCERERERETMRMVKITLWYKRKDSTAYHFYIRHIRWGHPTLAPGKVQTNPWFTTVRSRLGKYSSQESNVCPGQSPHTYTDHVYWNCFVWIFGNTLFEGVCIRRVIVLS